MFPADMTSPDPSAPSAVRQNALRLLPQRLPFLSGRDHALNELRAAALPGRRVALIGLPGVGKQQIALRFAQEYAAAHPNCPVLWVVASSRPAIESGYRQIAQELGLPLRESLGLGEIYRVLHTWLHKPANNGWLLILEGADDWQEFSDIVPLGANGCVLLTSRDAGIATFADITISVAPLGTAESVDLLSERMQLGEAAALDSTTRDALLQIAEQSGGLPLALEQAAAYMLETATTPRRYANLLIRGTEINGYVFSDAPPRTDVVGQTFSFALAQLEETNPAAAQLLRACAFFAPDNIPGTLLTQNSQVWPYPLSAACSDALLWQRTVQATMRFSLLRTEPATNTLSTHNAVLQWMREQIAKAGEEDFWLGRAVQVLITAIAQQQERQKQPKQQQSLRQILLPHLLSVCAHIGQYELTTGDAMRLLHQTGVLLVEAGEYERSLPLYERALTIVTAQRFARNTQESRQQRQDLATVRSNLASLYGTLGRYDEGIVLYDEVVAVLREDESNDAQADADLPSALASALNNQGELCRRIGQYELADSLFQEALTAAFAAPDGEPTTPTPSSQQKQSPEQKRQVATILDNLAAIREAQGDLDEAQRLYEQSLALRRNALGERHPEVAESLNDLAQLYDQKNDLDNAMRYYQLALAIFLAVLGPEHPRTAICRNNLGVLFAQMQDFLSARAMLEQARPVLENELKSHPRVATLLANLAQVECALGDVHMALRLSRTALGMIEGTLGTNHPESKEIRSMNDLLLEIAQEEEEEESGDAPEL